MFLAQTQPSEEVERVHLQTVDLFMSHCPDLSAIFLHDAKRVSLLGCFYLSIFGGKGERGSQFQRRIWQHIMPLDQEERDQFAEYEYLPSEAIRFLDEKWLERQKSRNSKISGSQARVVKAFSEWTDWMVSWVWVGTAK
jgi:hypothetical protein